MGAWNFLSQRLNEDLHKGQSLSYAGRPESASPAVGSAKISNKQQEELNQGNLFTEYFVGDYIFEKDRIFAYLNLSGEELKLYESIFPLLERNLRRPDLVVYLQSSVDRLMYNIKKRGRKMERNLTRSYIEELNEAYNNFFFRFNNSPLLIVNSTEMDFVQKEEDFNELFKQIFREDRGFTEYFKPESRRML